MKKLLLVALLAISVFANTETTKEGGVIVNITNAPINTNTNTNTNGESHTTISPEKIEHWLVSVGMANFKISDSEVNEAATVFGIQYFTNGLKEDGIGFGYNFTHADKSGTYEGYGYTLDESLSTVEVMYNFNIDGAALSPALISGTLTEEVTVGSTIISEDISVRGVGVYLYFPDVVSKGKGASLFAKRLYIQNTYAKVITIAGVQFTW